MFVKVTLLDGRSRSVNSNYIVWCEKVIDGEGSIISFHNGDFLSIKEDFPEMNRILKADGYSKATWM